MCYLKFNLGVTSVIDTDTFLYEPTYVLGGKITPQSMWEKSETILSWSTTADTDTMHPLPMTTSVFICIYVRHRFYNGFRTTVLVGLM